jgi:hypothetical protein
MKKKRWSEVEGRSKRVERKARYKQKTVLSGCFVAKESREQSVSQSVRYPQGSYPNLARSNVVAIIHQ